MMNFIGFAPAFPFVANTTRTFARTCAASFPIAVIGERSLNRFRIVSINEVRLH
jgi:hypothetical protein